MALPLLIPWNVVGAMWNIFALPDIGLLGRSLNALGIDYNFTRQPGDAWFTVILMDVWHWTSLVVLLAYAGLVSIPDAYYQAAKIDGARSWAVFRYIQLPKMKRVLTIAILLRFMDSFKIYTEPFVLTGGGPGNATTLLSIDLVKTGARPVRPRPGGGDVADLFPDHPAVQLDVLHRHDPERGVVMRRASLAGADPLHHLPDAADLLAARTCRSRPPTRSSAPSPCGRSNFTLRELHDDLHRSDLVHGLYQLADLRHRSTRCCRWRWRCRPPTPSRATASSATSICSSGC